MKYESSMLKQTIPLIIETIYTNFDKAVGEAQNIARPTFNVELPKERRKYVLERLNVCKNAIHNLEDLLETLGYVSLTRNEKLGYISGIEHKISRGAMFDETGFFAESILLEDTKVSALIGLLTESEKIRESKYKYVVGTTHTFMWAEGQLNEKEISPLFSLKNVKCSDSFLAALIPYIYFICGDGKSREMKNLAVRDLSSAWDIISKDEIARGVLRDLPEEKKKSILTELHDVFPECGYVHTYPLKALGRNFPEFF